MKANAQAAQNRKRSKVRVAVLLSGAVDAVELKA